VATHQLMLQLYEHGATLSSGRHRRQSSFVLGPLRPPVADNLGLADHCSLFCPLGHHCSTQPASPATLPIPALKCDASIGALVPDATDPHCAHRTRVPQQFRPDRHCSSFRAVIPSPSTATSTPPPCRCQSSPSVECTQRHCSLRRIARMHSSAAASLIIACCQFSDALRPPPAG